MPEDGWRSPRRAGGTPVTEWLSRLLLGSGLVVALGGGGLQFAGWVQLATYRQPGVRAPWSTPLGAAAETERPGPAAHDGGDTERSSESASSETGPRGAAGA